MRRRKGEELETESQDAKSGRLKISIARPKTADEHYLISILSPMERRIILVIAGTAKLQHAEETRREAPPSWLPEPAKLLTP